MSLARYTGLLPIAVWEVLEQASRGGFTTSSNFARAYAAEVALAASIGWISILIGTTNYAPSWHITTAGATALVHKEEMQTFGE